MSHSKLVISRLPIHIYTEFPLDESDNFQFISLAHIAGITNIRHKPECQYGEACVSVHFTIRLSTTENINVRINSVPVELKQQATEILCSQRDMLVYAKINKLTEMIGVVPTRYRIVEGGEA